MNLTPATLKAFEQHVLTDFPNEACGFVINDEYVSVANTAENPTQTFRISPSDHVKAEASGRIQAVLHSHPYDKFKASKWPHEWPTTMDMKSWMQGTVPWGITATCGEGISQLVWMDDSVIPPLEGREFIHGIHDCYSLIRDWFRINKGITIPNYARGIDWWHQGENLYEDNFANAGFERIDLDQIQVGDAILMKAASDVANHAAVVVGTNQILHHLFHRLSGTDTLSKWKRCIVCAVRYKGQE